MLGTTIGAYIYNRQTDGFSLLDPFPLHNWYTCLLEDESGTTLGRHLWKRIAFLQSDYQRSPELPL